MTTMSDRLKDTLGLLESNGIEIKQSSSQFDSDDDFVGGHPSSGGAVIPFKPKEIATSVPETANSDIRDDYVTSRNITHTLIEMAGSALEGALSVAVETQHPKAYTVFNELANTMRGLSKDLLEMQKIYQQIVEDEKAKKKAAAQSGNVTNNSVNITTSASLSEVLKMMREGKIDPNVTAEPVDEVIDV